MTTTRFGDSVAKVVQHVRLQSHYGHMNSGKPLYSIIVIHFRLNDSIILDNTPPGEGDLDDHPPPSMSDDDDTQDGCAECECPASPPASEGDCQYPEEIKTTGGNGRGEKCFFPFSYKGQLVSYFLDRYSFKGHLVNYP